MMNLFSSSAKKLAGDAFFLSLSHIVGIVSRIGYLLLAARLLGPELYGLLVYSQSWYLVFIPLASLGLRGIMLRQVGQHGEDAAGVVQQTVILTSFACLLSSAAAAWLGTVAEPNPMVRQAVLVFSLALLMRSLFFLGESVFVAHEKPRILLPIALFFRPAEALTGIAALLLGYGVIALAWIHAVSWGIQALTVLVISVRRGIMPPLSLPNRSGLHMLAQAFPLLLGGVLMGQIQQGPIIYYRWQGDDGLGQLSILVQLIATLSIIPMAGLQALLPAMTRKHIRDENEARNLGKKIISLSLLGGTFGALGAMVLAPVVLSPLIGDQYALALRHMGLAVALLGLYSAALAVNQLQTARGDYTGVFYGIGAGAGFMMLGFAVLRPESALLALCLGGLGYAGWLLTGAKMLGLLSFVAKRLVFYAVAVAIPYAFDFQAWSILASAMVLVGLNLFFNWQHVPQILQKLRERFHTS